MEALNILIVSKQARIYETCFFLFVTRRFQELKVISFTTVDIIDRRHNRLIRR